MSNGLMSLTLAGVLSLGGLGIGAATLPMAGERADCPGKITCPIDGKQVCKDRCPVGEQEQDEKMASRQTKMRGAGCCPLPGSEDGTADEKE